MSRVFPERGAELFLAGCPPNLQTLQPLPQASRVVSGWVGLGTQAQGWGSVGLWGASRRSWQPERGEAAWQQQQTAGGGGRRAGSTSTRVAQGSSGGRASERASERARSSPGRKRTFHTLAWRDLQPARCNGGGLCAAPTLEPRSLKMISTSKIFPNCCRDRERRGGRQEKGVMTAAALTIPLPRCSGKEDPRDDLPFFPLGRGHSRDGMPKVLVPSLIR